MAHDVSAMCPSREREYVHVMGSRVAEERKGAEGGEGGEQGGREGDGEDGGNNSRRV